MTNREKAQQNANEVFSLGEIGLSQLAYDVTIKTARWKRNQMIKRTCDWFKEREELKGIDIDKFIKEYKKRMEDMKYEI